MRVELGSNRASVLVVVTEGDLPGRFCFSVELGDSEVTHFSTKLRTDLTCVESFLCSLEGILKRSEASGA